MSGVIFVTDTDGKPIAGVIVAPVNGDAVVTDDDGFAFVDAECSPWLSVQRPGHAPQLVGTPIAWPLIVQSRSVGQSYVSSR